MRGELIGKGSYGRVYLALNATTGEVMAVKQVELPRIAKDLRYSEQLDVVRALRSESDTLRDLDHPNIVQYLGYEENADCLSIFLEYVPGGTIASCLRKYGKFDESISKSFTAQILNGLEYLHSKQILHRDLKSDNILVEINGSCKISDFGISKKAEGRAFTGMKGTVYWMAPEVLDSDGKGYDSKVDIWSIGCILQEMWTGKRPWSGEELVAVMMKLVFDRKPPPLPSEMKHSLSANALEFLELCFQPDPTRRPSAALLKRHPYLSLPTNWVFPAF
ncbi:kinase-like domain-containing protein, partial [Cyathus striatus]